MPSEAIYRDEWDVIQIIAPTGGLTAGELIQLPDGKAGYVEGLTNVAAGEPASIRTGGQVVIPKTTSIVFLDGGECFWDHSENKGHFKAVNDRDFYAGSVVGEHAAADTEVRINLNERPVYNVDLARDGFTSVAVGTAAAGGFGQAVSQGGSIPLEITATNEAQKVDAMSVAGFSLAAKGIFRGIFRVTNDGGSGVQDFSLGIADGTNATDFQSVNAFATIHLDGNVLAINAESDNNSTDVNPTDTTKVYAEGAALANRVEVWIDARDPASVKFYVEAVRVLTGTTFILTGARPVFRDRPPRKDDRHRRVPRRDRLRGGAHSELVGHALALRSRFRRGRRPLPRGFRRGGRDRAGGEPRHAGHGRSGDA